MTLGKDSELIPLMVICLRQEYSFKQYKYSKLIYGNFLFIA